MYDRIAAALLLAFPLLGAAQPSVSTEAAPLHPWAAACEKWDEWDKPGPGFKIHGNTYYVGTCGIAAILITSDAGHVLIDSGTEAGADVVLANIQSLGFDPKDVKLLLTSHEHFDHVGGLAKLQRETDAEIVTSEAALYVLSNATDHAEDPQFGMHPPMKRIAHGLRYDEPAGAEWLERFGIVPHATPGHTPGAMSWSWESCDAAGACRTIVYADSLSPVSADEYRFSDHPKYLADYLGALNTVAALDCGMLLTPHPSASDLHGLLARQMIGSEEPRIACMGYANAIRTRLSFRLAKERSE